MNAPQADKGTARTQKAIAEAFWSLITEREYGQISVTDICRRADYVRKTFYNHFDSKDDVVRCFIREIFRTLESGIDLRAMRPREILLVVFRFVLDNREALLLFYRRGLLQFARGEISAYITERHIPDGLIGNSVDPRAYKYIAAQVPAVLIGVIETWIESGFAEPPEFLAELAESLLYTQPG